MRAFALVTAALVVLAACGGGGNTAAAPSATATPVRTAAPTPAPTATPASKFAFLADLKSSNEVPPIADAEATCAGKGTFTLDTTNDATGKPTAAMARFDLTLSGCPVTTSIILFHIHQAPAGMNGGVKIDSGQTASQAIALTTGATAAAVVKSGIAVADLALVSDVIANPANYYFNVHSMLHSGGVVRGQLTKS